MVKKLAVCVLALTLISLLAPDQILAAKPRTIQRTATGRARLPAGQVASSVRFKANRLGIILNLSGLNNASSVTYELTYTAASIPQGARGTVSGGSNTATRELLFGTCSKNVCRWHTNITDARLTVTSKLNSGITTRKAFRLKV